MPPDHDSSGPSMVWVVDDDEDVAPHLRMILQRSGHEVTVRPLPDMAALRAALAEGGPAPDLVLVDRFLPAGNGATLVPEIRAIHPSTTIRLITAAPDEVSDADAEIGVIEKPPSLHTISDLLTT